MLDNMIKNVIFDLDGVLFDGCELHAKLFLEAVFKIKPDIILTKEDHDKTLNGLSTKKKLQVLGIDNSEAEIIYNYKQELTSKYINSIQKNTKNIKIFEYLLSLNYKLYCVTNSIRSTTETILKNMGILNMLSGVITNQDVYECKPSPEPYLTCYKKYSLLPEETLIIEDSPFGIESAKSSGGNVMSVRNCDDVTLDNILRGINHFNLSRNNKFYDIESVVL